MPAHQKQTEVEGWVESFALQLPVYSLNKAVDKRKDEFFMARINYSNENNIPQQ